MSQKIEIYESNAGALLLCVLRYDRCVAIFEGWEQIPETLCEAFDGLRRDPDSWTDYDGDLIERLNDEGRDVTAEDVYHEIVEMDDLVAETKDCVTITIFARKAGYAGWEALHVPEELRHLYSYRAVLANEIAGNAVYAVIDDETTAGATMFVEKLDATGEDEAISAAQSEWDRLTDAEKKHRDGFRLVIGHYDEEPEDPVLEGPVLVEEMTIADFRAYDPEKATFFMRDIDWAYMISDRARIWAGEDPDEDDVYYGLLNDFSTLADAAEQKAHTFPHACRLEVAFTLREAAREIWLEATEDEADN